MNQYGYAEGDPLNGSDPFGLKVCFRGSGAGRNLRHMSQAIDADIDTDANGCVSNASQVRSRGSKRSLLAMMFLSMVESGEEYGVEDGRMPRSCSYYREEQGGPGSGYCNKTAYVDANDFNLTWRAASRTCWFWGPRVKMNRQHVLVHELLGHGLNSRGSDALGVENTFRRSQGGAPRCADGAHR